MAHPHGEPHQEPQNLGTSLVEISVGYLLILAVMAIMFGFAAGVDLEIPWEIFLGVMAIWGLFGVLASRR